MPAASTSTIGTGQGGGGTALSGGATALDAQAIRDIFNIALH